ncbi:MAG: GAF domain-containing SpoIIE family protein phosphatase [Treponemataceae bacterium]
MLFALFLIGKSTKVDEVDSAIEADELDVKTLYQNSLFTAVHDFLLYASDSFGKNNDLLNFLEFANNTLIRETIADGGMFLLVNDLENQIAVKALSGNFPPPFRLPDNIPCQPSRIETYLRFAKFSLDENIFGKIISKGEPELIIDPSSDSRIFENGSETFIKCGSYIFIPIKNHEVSIALIALARKSTSTPFSQKDFEVANFLATLVSMTLKNIYSFYEFIEYAELNREIEIACMRREKMLTKSLNTFNTFSIGFLFNQTENACTDYHEALFSKKDKVVFMCMDVEANGFKSLETMVAIRSLFHLITNTSQNPSIMIEWINRSISTKLFKSSKINLSVILFNPETNTIQCSQAGNIPVYLIRKGVVTKLTESGLSVGNDANTKYVLTEQKLKKGDIICMFSDGILNTINSTKKSYTEEELLLTIIEDKLHTAQEITTKAKLHIRTIEGITPRYEDQTLFVLKSN